MKSGPTK